LKIKGYSIYVKQHIEIGKRSNIYTVKPGDTLADIAKAKHATVGNLLRANPKQIGNRNLIYPGQKLITP
jgi:LysM repeat protein